MPNVNNGANSKAQKSVENRKTGRLCALLDGKEKSTHNVKWNGAETTQLEMQLKMAIE